jgi:pilus assembly protein Flp/PilA
MIDTGPNPVVFRGSNLTRRQRLRARVPREEPCFSELIQPVLGFRPHIARMKTIRRFLSDETGATAIEYGLIAAGISLAIISVINGLGTKLNTKFTSINTSLK